MDQGASEAIPGATDCKLTLTALHHMGANDDFLRPHVFVSFTPQILSAEEGEDGCDNFFYFFPQLKAVCEGTRHPTNINVHIVGPNIFC